MDTGVFDEDRYWDVFVEYAKADPEDIHIRITAVNRGPEAARCTSCPSSGSATPGGPTGGRHAPSSRRPARQVRRHRRARTRRSERATSTATGRRPAVHRQRDQPLSPLGPAEPDPVPEGRHQRLRRQQAAGRREPGPQGDQGGVPPPSSRSAPGKAPRSACASRTRAPTELADPFGGASTRPSPTASRRPTTSTAPSSRRRSATTPRTSSARATPACCGRSRRTSTTSSGG